MPWIGTCPHCWHQFEATAWKHAKCPRCWRNVKRHKHGVEI